MLDRGFEADFLGRPLFAFDVGGGRQVLTDLDDGDPGRALVGMALDRTAELLADRERVGAAVDQAGWHGAEFSQMVG